MGNSRDKKLYDKTKHLYTGWFNQIHKRIQQRNRIKFGKDLDFDRWEFEDWIIKNYREKFFVLFDNYINNNYDSNFKPSIDRIDFTKEYVFENMQLITWKENNEKGAKERSIIGVSHMTDVTKKAVIMSDGKGNDLKIFESLSDAARYFNTKNSGTICECCKGKRKTYKGYYWRYKNA